MLIERKSIGKINSIINKIKLKVFSIETQYKFLRIKKIVENELEIYNEQKDLLVQQYSEKDEGGKIKIDSNNKVIIKKELLKDCAARLHELNSMQISMPDLYFTLDELDGLGLTLDDLMCLEPFIKT